MKSLKARVKGGRLILDEPTDLPEGAEVELLALDVHDLDPDDRARLLEAIEEGEVSIARGEFVDGIEFANQLLADREGQAR